MRPTFSAKPVEVLWIVDDHVGFTPEADLFTTEALLEAIQRDPRLRQGLTTAGRIWTGAAGVQCDCVPCDWGRLRRQPIDLAGSRARRVDSFDVVFIRIDPPFTQKLRHMLVQLTMVEDAGRLWFINSPSAMLARGSKLFNLRFGRRVSPGVVAADVATLMRFVGSRQESRWVAKPLDLAGGRSVLLLERHHAGFADHLTRLTREHGFIHLQVFRPEVKQHGETRHLVFDRTILAAWAKVPADHDFRANLDQGARLVAVPQGKWPARVTDIVTRVGQMEPGFVFYSLDMIGRWIGEINVENTGGLPNANSLYGRDHAVELLALLLRGVAERRDRDSCRFSAGRVRPPSRKHD